jgi:hypothetical protein
LLASGKGGHRFLRNDGGPIEKQKSKGGSHLCAANHCGRYRPAARHAQRVDTSTSHLGFTGIIREGTLMSKSWKWIAWTLALS